MTESLTKQEIIERLGLEPHPHEGGYFRRTYESVATSPMFGGERRLMSSIFYLLTNDSPSAFLHRNRADIVHYFHLGGPVGYLLIAPSGEVTTVTMGTNLAAGELLQLTVPGGYWKSSKLLQGEYGLISEAVSPGFDYADNELANDQSLAELGSETRHLVENWLSHG